MKQAPSHHRDAHTERAPNENEKQKRKKQRKISKQMKKKAGKKKEILRQNSYLLIL